MVLDEEEEDDAEVEELVHEVLERAADDGDARVAVQVHHDPASGASSSSSPFLVCVASGSCVCVSVCFCSVRDVFWFLCTRLHRNRHPPGGEEQFCYGKTSHKAYPSTNSRSTPNGAAMLDILFF